MNIEETFLKTLADHKWNERKRNEKWIVYEIPDTNIGLYFPLDKNAPDYWECMVRGIENFENISGVDVLPRFKWRSRTRTVAQCAEFLGLSMDEFLKVIGDKFTFHKIEQ